MARTSMLSPNAVADVLTVRTPTFFRRAAAKAPTNDPTLTTDISNENVRSSPPRSRTAKRGSTVEKLKARVPMIAIMTSGTRSSGTLIA